MEFDIVNTYLGSCWPCTQAGEHTVSLAKSDSDGLECTLLAIFARNYGTAAVISYNLKRVGGREGGKNVSVNGILEPNACEN